MFSGLLVTILSCKFSKDAKSQSLVKEIYKYNMRLPWCWASLHKGWFAGKTHGPWTYLLFSAISRLVNYFSLPRYVNTLQDLQILNSRVLQNSMAPFSLAQWLQLTPPCWLEVHQALWGAPGARGQTRSKGFGTIVRAAQRSLHWPLLARKAWFLQTNIASKIIRTYTTSPHMYICSRPPYAMVLKRCLCSIFVPGSARPWYLLCFGTLQPQKLQICSEFAPSPPELWSCNLLNMRSLAIYIYQTFFTQSCFILLTSYLLLAISYISYLTLRCLGLHNATLSSITIICMIASHRIV